MQRREFVSALGATALLSLGCASSGGRAGQRRLRRIGIQLYSLRDDARRDIERTLGYIAMAGYHDVEMLGSMNNFGIRPARLREVLDGNDLRAPSTHVSGSALDDLDRNLDIARTIGHEYIVVASLPISGTPTLDDYRRWADRLNEAGRKARERDVWIGFHNHASDFAVLDGQVAYDVLVTRTDPRFVRHQLDTGNAAMARHDPMEYMQKYGERYWLFHIKDVPQMGATADTELGAGIIDFAKLLASIGRIDQKHLFVEQESYPGAPIDSLRRDYGYISRLTL